MSVIDTVADVRNSLLARREITCDFAGVGGRLERLDAVGMVTKEYGLDGKTVIPMRLKNHVGRPTITGLFYVYDDESLARRHVNPTILARLEKSKAKAAEAAAAAEDSGDGEDAGDDAGDGGDADSKEEAAD